MIEPLEADPECSVVKGYARVCHTLDPDANPHALSPPVLGPWIGSALYRKEVFRQIGVFEPALRYSEDIDWFLRAREMGVRMHILKQVTLLVRRHETNMTLGRDCDEMNVIGVLRNALGRHGCTQTVSPNPLFVPRFLHSITRGRIVLIRDRPSSAPVADRGAAGSSA